MKLVKIRDKYMYKPITPAQKAKYNPNGVHTYLVYKDKRSGEVRAIRTTHMYEPQKEKLLEKGGLMVVKLPKIKYPSGIRNGYVTTDINGNPLDLKAVKAYLRRSNNIPMSVLKSKDGKRKWLTPKEKRRELLLLDWGVIE